MCMFPENVTVDAVMEARLPVCLTKIATIFCNSVPCNNRLKTSQFLEKLPRNQAFPDAAIA